MQETPESSVGAAAVAAALRRAVGALLWRSQLRVHSAWALLVADAACPWLRIGDPMTGRRLKYPSDPAHRLLDPGAVTVDSPNAPTLLAHDIQAVFEAPSPENQRDVQRFVDLDGQDGYVLTHQLLVIRWALELNRPMPQGTAQRRSCLSERLVEQIDAGHPLDLFAEQVGVLLSCGDWEPDRERCRTWARQLLAQRAPDGLWVPDRPHRQRYRDAVTEEMADQHHVLAAMVLALSGLMVTGALP